MPKTVEFRALNAFIRTDARAKLLSAFKRLTTGTLSVDGTDLAWIGRTNLEEMTVIFESGVPTGYAMMKADSSLKHIVSWA